MFCNQRRYLPWMERKSGQDLYEMGIPLAGNSDQRQGSSIIPWQNLAATTRSAWPWWLLVRLHARAVSASVFHRRYLNSRNSSSALPWAWIQEKFARPRKKRPPRIASKGSFFMFAIDLSYKQIKRSMRAVGRSTPF